MTRTVLSAGAIAEAHAEHKVRVDTPAHHIPVPGGAQCTACVAQLASSHRALIRQVRRERNAMVAEKEAKEIEALRAVAAKLRQAGRREYHAVRPCMSRVSGSLSGVVVQPRLWCVAAHIVRCCRCAGSC